MSDESRVVVFSQRSAAHRVWHASQYEFEDVIAATDDVTLITPVTLDDSEVRQLARAGSNRLRGALGRHPVSGLQRTVVPAESELFFAIFATAPELAHLPRLTGWQRGSGKKVAFLVELWTTQIDRYRHHLELLKDFDHIFLFSREALPALREITGVPCSYLATASDALRFAPARPAPPRVADVYSYGRRVEQTHQSLLREFEQGRLLYVYQTADGPFPITEYREHRLLLAGMLQRSRYTVVYRNNANADRARMTGGEDSLTNRYFEALAAGAVVLGSAPETDDFRQCFDWPDAVVEIGDVPVDELIRALDADEDRLARLRATSIEQSLRRHDWAHRWQDVLDVAGLRGQPALHERLHALQHAADLVQLPLPATGPGTAG